MNNVNLIGDVPDLLSRTVDPASSAVSLTGTATINWKCPKHGSYSETPQRVYALFTRQLKHLGCPDCKTNLATANNDRLIKRWSEKNSPLKLGDIPINCCKDTFWWKCEQHTRDYQKTVGQMQHSLKNLEKRGRSSFGCDACYAEIRKQVQEKKQQNKKPIPQMLILRFSPKNESNVSCLAICKKSERFWWDCKAGLNHPPYQATLQSISQNMAAERQERSVAWSCPACKEIRPQCGSDFRISSFKPIEARFSDRNSQNSRSISVKSQQDLETEYLWKCLNEPHHPIYSGSLATIFDAYKDMQNGKPTLWGCPACSLMTKAGAAPSLEFTTINPLDPAFNRSLVFMHMTSPDNEYGEPLAKVRG